MLTLHIVIDYPVFNAYATNIWTHSISTKPLNTVRTTNIPISIARMKQRYTQYGHAETPFHCKNSHIQMIHKSE